jgi:hypothetical protein
MQFDSHTTGSIFLKSFIFGTNKLSFDPHYKTVKAVSEKLGARVENMRALANKVAPDTIGDVPKSFMNNQVMEIFPKVEAETALRSSTCECLLPGTR